MRQTIDTPARYSCIVDDVPGIWSSLAPWLLSALSLGQVAPADLIVHHACPLREDMARLCERLGVAARPVPAFDARSPHCNKIRQLDWDFGGAGRIVLMDVDTVFAAPLPLERVRAAVAGKAVDLPNPSLEVLERVFRAAGLPLPPVIRATGSEAGGDFG
jgi:hypothetical protein